VKGCREGTVGERRGEEKGGKEREKGVKGTPVSIFKFSLE